MRSTPAGALRVPAYILVGSGGVGIFLGVAGSSLQLDVIGCIAALLGCQLLLWTGALTGYPRKRLGAILCSVLALGLGTFLIGIRVYAGPEAWSG